MIYYTYHIGWSKTSKHYYGVRGTELIPKDDLWIKYFTSSKYVKQYREEIGEPDIIEVRKTFVERGPALIWEQKVLIRVGAKKSENWLNRYDGSYRGAIGPKNHGYKISAATTGIPKSKEHSEKVSKALTGKYTWATDGVVNKKLLTTMLKDFLLVNQTFRHGFTVNESAKKKMSVTRKQLLNEGKVSVPSRNMEGSNNPMFGRKQREDSKELMAAKAKERMSDPSNRLVGEKNGMYGKHHSAESKAASSARMKKMKWYNNGKENLYQSEDIAIPEGFVRGRITGWNTAKKIKN
ncbi:MAG TPA: NUMOD3 domain-containing DNA-binding protein [Methanosarcina sp.]|nr:NUMOD3 domain-containing DNA-binding protein [Methanosarcina sp.]